MRLPIYLDYNATTPVDKRVLEAMLPWFSEQFGNAASRTHLYGWTAEEAVAKARKQVASLIHCQSKEIVFTSGATESNNLAIKGLFEKYYPQKKHIVTVQTEHTATLDACQHLEKWGAAVTYLLPQPDGIVSAQQVADALRPDTLLVSVMLANNEIGVLLPLQQIARLAHQKGVFVHTDATQAVGKIAVDVAELDVDLLSFSAHKMYGPKGVGALYVRAGVGMMPQMDGGGHERGRRSGTLNVPGIVGLGEACAVAQRELQTEYKNLESLRNYLENSILAQIAETFVNGNQNVRLPHVTNICFEGLDGENLLLGLKDLAVSTGSACTSASVLPSHVLKALQLSDAQAHASLRFSLGRFTTLSEIEYAISHLLEVVEKTKNNQVGYVPNDFLQ
ncbi:MAG: aminotransferase class V-fold PLP-dependent enzyme [Cytophagia bacterium]|nr:MAG: aminotransferase class V-fold PLP-dependent enzyme [Runella sp.]TAG20338.1 MAG: aminotransferase class V-fold PLP-dependent enzyme [Cytophagales bacterium]TAG39494.1 MAG: aminotransferase class V-fold PLP-dependent enzyme [Cytophagia bacterium]TAG51070.1 MAG: aminotransferase class V-fold PLP-dependent enzyme [Runella slithyformis]TAG71613.1 MAG: aminotransferase class V-fold PLP-dependent enzyme [Runella slithyformis]